MSQPTNELEKKSVRRGARKPIKILAICVLLSLIYVLWGTIQYPLWWYEIFFSGGYKNPSNLLRGALYIFLTYHVVILQTVIIVLAILIFSRTHVPKRLVIKINHLWKDWIISWTGLLIGIILILAIVMSVWSLESRTHEEREREQKFQQSMKELEESTRKLKAVMEENSNKVPLSVPTSFIYLDKEAADSLYGQYEPELVPSLMQEEIQKSTEVKGGINSYISTEAGQTDLNKKITEYRSIPKNSERKLKDLIRYLNEKNQLLMFRDIQPKSEELSELDNATKLLSQIYALSLDSQKLKTVRDRLLGDELRIVENQLRDLRGLTFVEGEWFVENQPDYYLFRHQFVENISNSPTCEVKIRKTAVSSQYRDAIEGAGKKSLRLSIFGNILVGLSESSRTVSLNPIAIF